MEHNLNHLNRIIKNDAVEELIPFNPEKGVMIADLVHFKVAEFIDIRETFRIYTDEHSFLLLYYPDSKFIPDHLDDTPVYYQFDNFEEITEILNELLREYNENSVLDRYSNNLNSELPEWVVLKPRYIQEEYFNTFINSLTSVTDTIDKQKDLTKAEKNLVDRWFSFRENQEGVCYLYV